MAEAPAGKPFNLLLVGSDSRSFVSNATQVKAFGDDANAGGNRSDVTMVARFDPAAKTVTVLSIPRDLWVDIPGNGSIQGMNRINAAFDSGPDLLIQTIEKNLGIPVNHYVAVNFPGFSGMVDALGGITMKFPTEVKDQFTGLDVTTTGCQSVNGTVALELVRSRHLYYMSPSGYWEYDGLSDFSRIQRQDSFFRAVLAKLNQSITNPFTINSFIGAAVGNLTIDDTLSQGDLFHIAQDFRGLASSHLVTETLPTLGYTTDGGASVLKQAQPYAQNMIDAFNLIGTTPAPAITAVGAPQGQERPRHDRAHGAPQPGQRERPERVDAQRHRPHHRRRPCPPRVSTSPRSATPRHLSARAGPPRSSTARPVIRPRVTLESVLGGPVTLVPDPSLSGQTVSLLVAGSQLTVTGSSPGGTATPPRPPPRSRPGRRRRPRRRSPRTSTPTRSRSPGTRSPAPSAGRPRRHPGRRRRCGRSRAPARWAGRAGSGRLAALPYDPAALPLGRPAPDALTLAVGQGVLQARLTDRADGAHSLGLGRVGLVLGDGVERLDVETPAGCLLAPRGGDHGKHFLVSDNSADT